MEVTPEQVSWLSFNLLAAPSRPVASGIIAAFVTISVAGRRERLTPFPCSQAVFHRPAGRQQTKKSPDLVRQVRGSVFILGFRVHDPFPRGSDSEKVLRAGLLASRSSYRPRLPTLLGQWQRAAFVPGYSGGSATDFHRLPCSGPWATRSQVPIFHQVMSRSA